MNPIKTKETNFTFLGPGPDISDLPCYRDHTEGNTFAIWNPTDAERQIIANGGFVRLGIYRQHRIPPVSLQAVHNAGCYERVPAPCVVCGKEIDDPIHENGDGTHAYKTNG